MHITQLNIKNFKRFKGTVSVGLTNGLNILVGDNEVGKSTILEAIHLVLTGSLHGRLLRNDLSQSLFNNETVSEYLASFDGDGPPQAPPEILIEARLAGDDLALFEGDENTDKSKRCGLYLRIAFAEKYQAEYEALLKSGPIRSLPIEFYEVTWRSFARQEVTARSIPVKSALIDSASVRFQNGVDVFVARIVRDLLDTDDVMRLTQAHRSMRDSLAAEAAVDEVNRKIQESAALTSKRVHLSADLSSTASWESVLVTYVDDVPFQHIGRGEQSLVKTRLALGHKKAKEANILLIEEPENHLSHTKLNELVSAIATDSGGRQIIVSTHSSFVANKLGLSHLLLLTRSGSMRLQDLPLEAQRYFQRLPGYDTLRLILCRKAILVEGPSDELVIQKAYQAKHAGKLPIQDGVDVISVGTSFLRFLELSKRLKIETSVVTDNDGDIGALQRKYAEFINPGIPGIEIFYDAVVDANSTAKSGKTRNHNTLEPKLLKANGVATINGILGASYGTAEELIDYMLANKTECALKLFETDLPMTFPEYIEAATS